MADIDGGLDPIFVLAPPLGLGAHLAACLGRSPALLDLPAVHIMAADDVGELARRWGGRLQGHDHGLIRAVAALVDGGRDEEAADRAAAWLASRATMASGDLLTVLAKAARPRRLVDSSFLYALDDAALERIARAFPRARFVHLLRHPMATLPTAEAARARAEGLWLRPHLRIHAYLAERPPETWVRLRVEALPADPRPQLTGLLHWLGEPGDGAAVDRLLGSEKPPIFAAPGPPRAPHGVDPALIADTSLAELLAATAAPRLDDGEWEAAGFDAETRAMARLFGYA